MKVAARGSRKPKVNLHSESYSLSTAKTYLGRLMEKAEIREENRLAKASVVRAPKDLE